MNPNQTDGRNWQNNIALCLQSMPKRDKNRQYCIGLRFVTKAVNAKLKYTLKLR